MVRTKVQEGFVGFEAMVQDSTLKESSGISKKPLKDKVKRGP